MPDLLVEIGTEEIPAGYIAPALQEWVEFVRAGLDEARLTVGDIVTDATPRRLVLAARDVADKADDVEEEVAGPPAQAAYKDGKPTKALEGWLKGLGLEVGAETTKTVTEGKGKKTREVERVVVQVKRAGAAATDVLPALLQESLLKLHFPKRMRWGAKLADDREFDFPRPVRYVCALLDNTALTLDVPVPCAAETEGHPFLARGDAAGRGARVPVESASIAALGEVLRKQKVILSTDERKIRIEEDLKAKCSKLKVAVTPEDLDRLLPEVANLVEWPSVVIGQFDAAFLELPDEVIRESMIGHQRYFPLVDARTKKNQKLADGLASKGEGRLVNAFATVANRADDTDDSIRDGNQMVLRARLADARFFEQEDRKQPLQDYLPKLETVIYHQQLGSYAAKVARLEQLADNWFSRLCKLDGEQTEALNRAAKLCKADLVTQMVFEFTELQGVMGGHYAACQGEPEEVSQAIAEHYRPAGRHDDLPESLVGAVLSLADKIDALAGYFLIDAPTRGGDPLGLRRLSISVLRVLANRPEITASVDELFRAATNGYTEYTKRNRKTKQDETHAIDDAARDAATDRFVEYFADRLRNFAGDEYSHDVIDAAIGAVEQPFTQVADLFTRLAAVREIAASKDAETVRELAERTCNISNKLTDDERNALGEPSKKLLKEAEEKALFETLEKTAPKVQKHLDAGEFVKAAAAWTDGLAESTHAFFDKVPVLFDAANDCDVPDDLKTNRLALLTKIYRLLANRFAALDRLTRTA